MSTASRWLVTLALAAPVLLVLPLPVPLAVGVAVGLLCILPGVALSRVLAPADPVLAGLLAIAGSVAVTIAVSTVLMYLRIWSGAGAAVGVGLFTAGVVLCGEKVGRDEPA